MITTIIIIGMVALLIGVLLMIKERNSDSKLTKESMSLEDAHRIGESFLIDLKKSGMSKEGVRIVYKNYIDHLMGDFEKEVV